MKTFITENKEQKIVGSKYYNYTFNKETGLLQRWGQTKEDDPILSPLGPEIADIEISTICNHNCTWCYKSNTAQGKNMSFDTFRRIFHLLKPKNNSSITQIAFGIGSLNANPDLWKIMEYTRENGVISNITVNGRDINKDNAKRLANICGAVSVSNYHNPVHCYNAVKQLTDMGLKQVNIHQLMAEQTHVQCFNLFDAIINDPWLEQLNAVVFLGLKPKGERNKYTLMFQQDFKDIVTSYIEAKINVGTDSCLAPFMLQLCNKIQLYATIQSIEPCESGLFSIYINVDGEVFPCSFAEGINNWKIGISTQNVNNFLEEIWYHRKMNEWRQILVSSSKKCDCELRKYCRSCPIYPQITPCKG